jgi:DNA-binding transcriptional LysR family regulator
VSGSPGANAVAGTGFQPRISYPTDDYVAIQSLVAAGLGVTTPPGLALTAVRVAPLPDPARHVLTATYGQPPATAALLTALADAASRLATPATATVPDAAT